MLYCFNFFTFTKFQKFSKASVMSSIFHKYNNSNFHDVMIQTKRLLIPPSFRLRKSRTKLLFSRSKKTSPFWCSDSCQVLLPYVMKQTALPFFPLHSGSCSSRRHEAESKARQDCQKTHFGTCQAALFLRSHGMFQVILGRKWDRNAD